MKLNAKQLRVTKPVGDELANIEKKPIYIVLDNVLDTYNIGSIFRLADAVTATEIILCGGSETPPSSRIHKAAVGTEEWVRWSYEEKAIEAIKKLRERVPGIQIVAVEQSPKAVNLYELNVHLPVAIVVGHETEGVTSDVLDASDVIVEIPMWGVNRSLNVVVSTAVVTYKVLSEGGCEITL